MPYKDPEKQREAVKKNVRKLRKNKNLLPYITNGELNIVAFLNSPEIKIKLAKMIENGLDGTRTNSQFLRLISQILGLYTEKKEETIKYEPGADEYIRIAQRVIQGLKDSCREAGGMCPICGFGQALYEQPRLDTEREHEEDSEVATVALLT